jgi:hypothetical protein
MKLIIYPTPLHAFCTLEHDSGFNLVGFPDIDQFARQCVSFDIPPSTPNGHGAWLNITLAGKVPVRQKGILYTNTSPYYPFAGLMMDDFVLQDEKVCPECPETEPEETDPLSIINEVYATGEHDLSTKEGCGKFTEVCVEQIHNRCSKSCGHIEKTGAQNQYNGHAVDALMILKNFGEIVPGVYDIITDSESPEAKPAFNYKHDPQPELWYYPA